MLNQVNLIGNVGRIETRVTQNQLSVTNFSLAVSEKVKDLETVYWAECVAWGKTSELLQKYVTKGKKLFVTGKLMFRTWEKEGVKFSKTEINVKDVIFLSPAKDGFHDDTVSPPASPSQFSQNTGHEFDDLPF